MIDPLEQITKTKALLESLGQKNPDLASMMMVMQMLQQKPDTGLTEIKEELKNLKESEAFLAENGRKEGVVTLPSGLQYKVIKEGSGPTPKATDTVITNYRGTLLNGTEFDSSYKRGQPATFGVTQVIPGWTEALQKMNVGSKWQLFIPAKLAYGERGPGGPNAMLLFDVELIGIKEAKAGE